MLNLVVISIAVVPLLLTVGACLRARRNQVAQAEAALESPLWSMVFTATGAVMMLGMIVFAMSLHPPTNVLEGLGYFGVLVLTAIAASVVCNKRLVVVGDRLIDISMTGRRREMVLSGPVRFDPVLFGWRLQIGQQSMFMPGYWLMGDTDTSRREVDVFKEFVMTRAERPTSE
jgi:hypothetical protein